VVLFRFLFAPVLLAVAVLSASPERHAAPPPHEAGAAHATAPAGPPGVDRADAGAPTVGAHAAATRHAPAR
jgi:hypothetical protein